MPLTKEEFDSFFQYFAPPGKRNPSDCRKHQRVPTAATATILPLAGGQVVEPMVVQMHDISRMGLRFTHERKFAIGDQFLLCLVSANLKMTRAILCTVRRCELAAGGKFNMGCEFLDTGEQMIPTDLVMPGLKRFHKEADDAESCEDAA